MGPDAEPLAREALVDGPRALLAGDLQDRPDDAATTTQLADWLQDESELLPALRRRGEGRSGLEDVPEAAFERRFAWQAYLKDARDSNGCGCS